MAATKDFVTVVDSESIPPGGGQTTAAQDLRTRYDTMVSVKLTNGATGPSAAATVQVEISPDNTNWYAFGALIVGKTGNDAIKIAFVELPLETNYVRFVVGPPTGQAVTALVQLSRVTELLWG